ncbi:hypothetical protein BDQ12DRAFT_683140 [Crucibulum laeve]|uniref:Ribosomal protein/NADH dehydrogenase domain-containing protein n=1 Tax=Crucibulum laeve TaxID=68775 RepID=A0A5C3M0J0_9AGAR|nr:hypothetical protein BDQ12DRAFT_683140 [Crucibulum laeve]
MPHKVPGKSHLASVLQLLNQQPRLEMPKLKSLKITLAAKTDHLGPRRFVKDQLPRIRYANPDVEIIVERVKEVGKRGAWRPELRVEFNDGQSRTLDLLEKRSTLIVKELMDVAGGSAWADWQREQKKAGLPVLEGEDLVEEAREKKLAKKPQPALTLKAFLEMQAKSPKKSGEGEAKGEKAEERANVILPRNGEQVQQVHAS